MDITSPTLDLGLKFNTAAAFKTAQTALGGNAFLFNAYKDVQTLRFYFEEAIANAILHIAASGLQEDVDFVQVDTVECGTPA